MSAVMKDIERQVGTKLYDIIHDCQDHLAAIRTTVEDAVDSPLVGNGVQKALKEYLVEVEKLANRHTGIYTIIRERFGLPENTEPEEEA